MEVALSSDDRKWRAENDARTLAQTEVINSDPDRLRLAKEAAQKMAKEQVKEAKAMSKVAGGKSPSGSTEKPRMGSEGPQRLPDGNFNVFRDVTKR